MHHLAGVGLGGAADDLSNQSLHGALLRFGLNGPLEITLFLLLGAAVGALGLRRANREHRDDQPQPDPDRAHRTTTVRAHFRFPLRWRLTSQRSLRKATCGPAVTPAYDAFACTMHRGAYGT